MPNALPIPEVNPGQTILADDFNALVRVQNRQRNTVGDGSVVVSESASGSVVKRGLDHGAPIVQAFCVREVHGDYLTCAVWDGISPGDIRYVAKPYPLWRSTFDGRTVHYPDGDVITCTYQSDTQRTLVRASDSLSQVYVIAPLYLLPDPNATGGTAPNNGPWLGDIILAIANFGAALNIVAADGTPIEWMDMNFGRVWSLQAT